MISHPVQRILWSPVLRDSWGSEMQAWKQSGTCWSVTPGAGVKVGWLENCVGLKMQMMRGQVTFPCKNVGSWGPGPIL